MDRASAHRTHADRAEAMLVRACYLIRGIPSFTLGVLITHTSVLVSGLGIVCADIRPANQGSRLLMPGQPSAVRHSLAAVLALGGQVLGCSPLRDHRTLTPLVFGTASHLMELSAGPIELA